MSMLLMRVAVVGAGIMGSCVAKCLAERGHQVTLFEQFKVNHVRGSSHGRSRIIRKAYPDAFYAQIMDEGYGMWTDVAKYSDTPMLYETGLLYFGTFESDSLREVLQGLQQLEVPHEVLDHEQSRRLFPRLRLRPGEIGIFTPEAGWVDADAAVRACISRFRACGGSLLEGEKADVQQLAGRFDRYVICTGAWIREAVDIPVEVTLQTFGYVDSARDGHLDGPVWIEDGEDLFYGFPSEPGTASYKIGLHTLGAPISPDADHRTPPFGACEAIRREATDRFAERDPSIRFTGCLYTSTADEDFVLGRHGDNGYFLSACSGHGFKFGPWMGRLMSDIVEERDAPENHPRFCWPKPLLEA